MNPKTKMRVFAGVSLVVVALMVVASMNTQKASSTTSLHSYAISGLVVGFTLVPVDQNDQPTHAPISSGSLSFSEPTYTQLAFGFGNTIVPLRATSDSCPTGYQFNYATGNCDKTGYTGGGPANQQPGATVPSAPPQCPPSYVYSTTTKTCNAPTPVAPPAASPPPAPTPPAPIPPSAPAPFQPPTNGGGQAYAPPTPPPTCQPGASCQPGPDSTYTWCAGEVQPGISRGSPGTFCTWTGTRTVVFGANGHFDYYHYTASPGCNIAEWSGQASNSGTSCYIDCRLSGTAVWPGVSPVDGFAGDPAPNVVKACFLGPDVTPVWGPAPPNTVNCGAACSPTPMPIQTPTAPTTPAQTAPVSPQYYDVNVPVLMTVGSKNMGSVNLALTATPTLSAFAPQVSQQTVNQGSTQATASFVWKQVPATQVANLQFLLSVTASGIDSQGNTVTSNAQTTVAFKPGTPQVTASSLSISGVGTNSVGAPARFTDSLIARGV